MNTDEQRAAFERVKKRMKDSEPYREIWSDEFKVIEALLAAQHTDKPDAGMEHIDTCAINELGDVCDCWVSTVRAIERLSELDAEFWNRKSTAEKLNICDKRLFVALPKLVTCLREEIKIALKLTPTTPPDNTQETPKHENGAVGLVRELVDALNKGLGAMYAYSSVSADRAKPLMQEKLTKAEQWLEGRE